MGPNEFYQYNQIMEVKRRATFGQKKEKHARGCVVGSLFEDGNPLQGMPRKKIKISSNKILRNSQVLSYSKIPEVPQIKLTLEDLKKDPVELLVQLEKKHHQFGAVKITLPDQWNGPFCFNFGQIGITIRVQYLQRLREGKAFKQKQDAYNVRNFQTMANEFQKSYKFKTNPAGLTHQEKVQEQFWNLVNGKTEQSPLQPKTRVEYAADLPVSKFGSGFPLSQSIRSRDANIDYHASLFNLNNIYKSDHSILKIAASKKEYISGVTTPWVYMGMMFSTFCWHVEDLWLNSINYSHKGDTKTWYIIPRKNKEKFDSYVAQKTGREDLLNRITFMIDPLQLIRNGIQVYKVNQRPGDYVCTFLKAYHAGFSHGFNVGEAVNLASPLSLPIIEQSVKYTSQRGEKRPAVLSYDWLVYENYLHGQWDPRSQMGKIIEAQYRRIIEQEYRWVEAISQKYPVQLGDEIPATCKYDRNSCSKCRNYEYLSSLRCSKCKKNYCKNDFKDCCQAPFELVHRQLNQDRKPLIALLKKRSKRVALI